MPKFVDSSNGQTQGMAEGKTLFTGEEHAALYKKFRPYLGQELVHTIIDFLGKKFNPSECDAADVGCGSGQGTLPLAPFLRHIVGVDPSEAQIKEINAESNLPKNVEFRVGEAESLPFKDSSLQLVAVKSALHWFSDIPKFFQEADRVLQPDGVLAISSGTGFGWIFGYEDETKELFASLAREHRTPEWTAKTSVVFNKFKDFKFPYDECVRNEEFYEDRKMTVREVLEHAKTRSDVAKYLKEKPEEAQNALKETEEKLMKIIGATGHPEETSVVRRDQQILILCRKP